MPYKVKKQGDKYVVYKKDTGKRVGATAGNKEALRKYLAALHINAKESVVNEIDSTEFDVKIKQIMKQNYPGFIASLGKFATDPKFRQFVIDTDASKSDVNLVSIPVTKLIPTQNEIDVNKSLSFPLSKPAAAAYALRGGSVKVASPIIVFNGKYIIDGHHRWSQLYAVNKDAKIVAYNFTNPEVKNPLDALKATQIAIIGAGATKIPKAVVEGKNLLKMDEASIKQYVIAKIADTVVDVFAKTKNLDSKESVADYIWENVDSMQSTSQPIKGAPGRGIMPQADAVPGGLPKTISKLKQGIPTVAEQRIRKVVRSIVREYLNKSK